ncbi:MAG: alpha/beta fold hydrolase [Paludibacter sp.]
MTTNYFIIPGYGGSGSNHWQTYFEKTQTNFQRINQKDWDNPNIDEWVENIDKAIEGYDPETVVLVAHSLGCLTVVEWAKQYHRNIKAALLVAPLDTEVIKRKIEKKLFEVAPIIKFPFPTTLVASTNDPWVSIEKAEFYARSWGCGFINIGDAGHINNLSGYGEWEQGLEILKKLVD